MKTTISKISLRAPASRVWDALTQPALVKQWQYGSDLITDWNIGGTIVFRNEWNGQVFEQNGTVLEFDAPRQLRYSLFFPQPGLEDIPANRFLMTYRLLEAEGGVELRIIQEDPRELADLTVQDEEENAVLSALKSLVES